MTMCNVKGIGIVNTNTRILEKNELNLQAITILTQVVSVGCQCNEPGPVIASTKHQEIKIFVNYTYLNKHHEIIHSFWMYA